MARDANVPRGRVDVEGDAGAVEVRVDHAPAELAPDERGIALVADVMVRGLVGGVATIRVRGGAGFHYAAIVVREGIADFLRLELRAEGVYTADVAVDAGRTLHLTIVAGDTESGMAMLEAEVEAGGTGMGGEAEMTSPAPSAPPPPPAPSAPPPTMPQMDGEEAAPEPPATRRIDLDEAFETSLGDDVPRGADGLEGVVIGGGGGQDVDAAPAPDRSPSGPSAPQVDGSAPIDAQVAAQMPADLFEGVPFDVIVTLSREGVKIPKGTAGDVQPVKFRPRRDIRIAVQASGFDVPPDAISEVVAKLPAPGKPDEYSFRLMPGEPGIGRVVVTVTQEPEVTPLAAITLSTVILDADDAPPATIRPGEPNRAEVTAAAPPKEVAHMPTLAIEETISRGHSVLKITAKVGSDTATNTICLLDKPTYVDGVYQELGAIREAYRKAVKDDGVPANIAVARAEESLRALGTRIATTLLGDEVNALLWAKRRRLTRLVIQTSGELDIPWEIVHLVRVGGADHDDASHFLGDKGLTRWLWGTKRPTALPVRADRVVAIAPEYEDENLRLTGTQDELKALHEALQQDVPPPIVTRDEVRARIGAGFDLLHFAGHGRWRSADPRAQEIALAAFVEAQDDGSASYRDVDAREDLPASESAPFVFLSACDVGRLQRGTAGLGGFAEVFLRGGAGVFIGCNWAVRDDVTAEFAKTLYSELFTHGKSLGDAAIAARNATRAAHDLTGLAFTVFADPRAQVSRA